MICSSLGSHPVTQTPWDKACAPPAAASFAATRASCTKSMRADGGGPYRTASPIWFMSSMGRTYLGRYWLSTDVRFLSDALAVEQCWISPVNSCGVRPRKRAERYQDGAAGARDQVEVLVELLLVGPLNLPLGVGYNGRGTVLSAACQIRRDRDSNSVKSSSMISI